MAEGGWQRSFDSFTAAIDSGRHARSFKHSFSKASGECDESFCEPCQNNYRWIAVEGYCQICQEYLCVSCLGVHKSQKLTRGHTILDKDQMPKGQASSANQDLCVEVCKTHHLQIVKFYCKAHDEPGCVDCMTLHHTACKKDRVQDISDGFQATEEFQLIQQQLRELLSELEEMKGTLEENLKNLDSAYITIQHQITSFRQYVNDYLDKMQKQITDEIATMKTRYETEIKQFIAENDSMKSEVDDTLKRIQKDSDTNANSIFVITKQAMKRLVTMESELARMELSREEQQYEFKFKPSAVVQHLVSDNTPLGTLQTNALNNAKASYRGSINVKTKDDKQECWITDCTLLTPDILVAVDNLNQNLKLLDVRNNSIISNCQTPSAPEGITAVSTDQIAVTLPYDCKIQLYNVANMHTFSKQHEIQVKHACRKIAYKNGTFAISYAFYPFREGSTLEIIDTQGIVLYTMTIADDKYRSNTNLPLSMYITFGQDIGTLIVSDPNYCVKLVTFQGQTLRTLQCDKHHHPQGIALQPNGFLLVCNQGSDSVRAVSPDFKTSTIILSDDINIKQPISLTYCDTNHKLYISCISGRRNAIHVYDLKSYKKHVRYFPGAK